MNLHEDLKTLDFTNRGGLIPHCGGPNVYRQQADQRHPHVDQGSSRSFPSGISGCLRFFVINVAKTTDWPPPPWPTSSLSHGCRRTPSCLYSIGRKYLFRKILKCWKQSAGSAGLRWLSTRSLSLSYSVMKQRNKALRPIWRQIVNGLKWHDIGRTK